jgi:multiple sugar transport system ATP-binding protein
MANIDLHGIVKRYGRTEVLNSVSLAVGDGEFLALLGPSGCGKSTLLRVIAGLEPQDGGRVEIGGRPVDGLVPKQRDVAMVFQSYALYPHLTAKENIALPLLMRRLSHVQRLPLIGTLLPRVRALRRQITRDVQDVAGPLGIAHLLHRKPGQLSGGQRQRVALARAMIRSPAVFLMDEPLSNLDAKLRVSMRTEIVDLHRRLGSTFVYVTHDQAEAMTMADRVAVMIDGRIIQIGTAEEIYNAPDDLRVAEFVGTPSINTLTATSWYRLCADRGGIALPEAAQTVAFRPEAAALVAATAGPGTLPGRIRRLENLGSDMLVHVSFAEDPAQTVIVRADPAQRHRLSMSQMVGVRPDPGRLLCFAADGRRLGAAGLRYVA